MFLGSPRKMVHMVIITTLIKLCWEDEGRKMGVVTRMRE